MKKRSVVFLVYKSSPVFENKNAYFLRRESIWGCMQWKRTCFSSWTLSLASHKSQVGEEVEFQVAVSTRRVWARSLKRATLRMNDISRKVKKHVPGKPIGRMGNQNSLCRQCAPLAISKRFAVALSGVYQRKVSETLDVCPWGPRQTDWDY
jgi:hypothetical protein